MLERGRGELCATALALVDPLASCVPLHHRHTKLARGAAHLVERGRMARLDDADVLASLEVLRPSDHSVLCHHAPPNIAAPSGKSLFGGGSGASVSLAFRRSSSSFMPAAAASSSPSSIALMVLPASSA